jgi:hypothetical protein
VRRTRCVQHVNLHPRWNVNGGTLLRAIDTHIKPLRVNIHLNNWVRQHLAVSSSRCCTNAQRSKVHDASSDHHLCLLLAVRSFILMLHCTLIVTRCTCPEAGLHCVHLAVNASRNEQQAPCANGQCQMPYICSIMRASSPVFVSAATSSATRSSRARNAFVHI